MDGNLRIMDPTLQIFAVMQASESVNALKSVLDGVTASNIDIRQGNLQTIASRLSTDDAPDILFVDLSLEDKGEIETLSQIIREHGSSMAVIATARNAELTGIRQLMRIGVADFVPQPLNRADVVGAMESASAKLIEDRKGQSTLGRVITFIRSCGGVGATTLAVQSAVELTGSRKDRHSVALLDFDLQFGNAGLLLDIQSAGGMPLILESPNRLDPSFLRASMTTHESGVCILAAPESIVPLNALNLETVSRILSIARDEFEYIVCDLPHAWTNWTPSILQHSDRIVLVTELSVTALQRTRRQLDIMADQGLEDVPLSVIVNRCDGGWGAKGRRKQAEAALGHSIDHCIHDDPKTAEEARDRGVPLSEIRSRSKTVRDLRDFLGTVKTAFERDAGNQAG